MQIPSEAEQRRFQGENGLQHDAAFLEHVRRHGTSNEYGVPLMPDELEDLRARRPVESTVHLLAERASREDGYAGLWLDQRNHAMVVVHMVGQGPHEILEQELQRLLPSGGRLKIVSFGWSLNELEAVHRRIAEDLTALQHDGYRVVGVGTDVKRNVVEVHVLRMTKQERAALEARYQHDPRIRWEAVFYAGPDGAT